MPLVKFFSILVFLAISAPAQGQDLVAPHPDFAASDVVEIQLRSLQQNDTPYRDFGIAQTWAFAHPANKRMTGPLARFTLMIKSPNYRNMINHVSHKIEPVITTRDRALFAVSLKTAENLTMSFKWEVQKVKEGIHAGSWMTTIVSPPLRDGDAT